MQGSNNRRRNRWALSSLLTLLCLSTSLCQPSSTRAASQDCAPGFGEIGNNEAQAKPGDISSFRKSLQEAGLAPEAKVSAKQLKEAFAESWYAPQKLEQLTLFRGKVYDSQAFQAEALDLALGKRRKSDLAFLEVKDGHWIAHAQGGGDSLRAELQAAGGKAILYPLSHQQVQELPLDRLTTLVGQAVFPDCPITPEGKGKAALLKALDLCVVNAYTTTRFYVNKPLWTGKFSDLSGEDWGYVRTLDQALARLPDEKPLTVYRGTKAGLLPIPAHKGELLELKSFTSTSPNKESAKGFLSGEDDLLMVIHAEHAKRVSNVSGAAGEDELLLPRGTWVRYEKLETRKLKVFSEESGQEEERLVKILHLTEVPAPAAPGAGGK